MSPRAPSKRAFEGRGPVSNLYNNSFGEAMCVLAVFVALNQALVHIPQVGDVGQSIRDELVGGWSYALAWFKAFSVFGGDEEKAVCEDLTP